MSTDACDWLLKASADRRSAHWELKALVVNRDAVVFHAQQSIEKLMKGVLAGVAEPVERTHELNILAHAVKRAFPAWTWDVEDLAALQPGAVLLRYPGYNASDEDVARAIDAGDRLWASLIALTDPAIRPDV